MGLSPRGFSPSQLKKSYYTLSKQYHPDKNSDPEANEMFQKVKTAYEILQSAEKRMAYDVF